MILDTAKYLGPCDCGRDHELRTKLVVCEHGALKNFDKYMDDCGLSGFRTGCDFWHFFRKRTGLSPLRFRRERR